MAADQTRARVLPGQPRCHMHPRKASDSKGGAGDRRVAERAAGPAVYRGLCCPSPPNLALPTNFGVKRGPERTMGHKWQRPTADGR
jgi:hypothetical protein